MESRVDPCTDKYIAFDHSIDLKSVDFDEDFGCNDLSGLGTLGTEIDVSTDEPEVRTRLDESFNSKKILDMDVAFDAACGDYDFLVNAILSRIVIDH